MSSHTTITDQACPAMQKKALGNLFGEISQLEDIHDSLDDIIWAASFNPYSCLYLNRSAEKVFGYSVSEMLNNPGLFTESIHPADRETFYESVGIAYTTGKSSCEFRVTHKDGTIRVLKAQAILHYDKQSDSDILTGIATDITRETIAGEAMLANKLRLRAIIDNTTDLIWSVDRDMCVVEANSAYRNFVEDRFGIKTVYGKNMFDILPAGDSVMWKESSQEVLQGRACSVMHEWKGDDEKYVLKINFNPILGSDGIVSGFSCFVSDVTAQCLQLLEIERKNTVLAEIASLQSHQVRGPLATIIGLARLFNNDNLSDTINKEILEGIVQTAEKLEGLIHEIDDKTKFLETESGKPLPK